MSPNAGSGVFAVGSADRRRGRVCCGRTGQFSAGLGGGREGAPDRELGCGWGRTIVLVRRPETRFVSVGRDRVAFQVVGEGPPDVLLLKGWGASVDAVWEHPGHLRLFRMMTTNARLMMLDHRGAGMSDAVPESRIGDLDERIDDVLAVLDVIGADQVCVCGEGDGALTAIKLAATYPERVDRLVLFNPWVAVLSAGWNLASAAATASYGDEVRETWGNGALMALLVPNFADDLEFCARFERMGARPSAAAALLVKLASTDVRPFVGRIRAPTLVAYSGDLNGVTVEEARQLAEQIPDARLFEGSSSTFYWGGGVLEEVAAFVSGSPSVGNRDLATLLFTDVVELTRAVVTAGDDEWRQTLNFLDDLVAARAARSGGRVVKQTGDGHLVEFARPGDAVDAALGICVAAPTLGVTLRAGVHTGEIERRENGDVGGLTVHIAARVAALAGPGEVVVSRTVADLLGAHNHELQDRGDHELKGVPGHWQLFTINA